VQRNEVSVDHTGDIEEKNYYRTRATLYIRTK